MVATVARVCVVLAACVSFSFDMSAACGQSASPNRVDSLSAGPVGANADLIEPALQKGDIARLAAKLREHVMSAVRGAGGPSHLSEVLKDKKVRASLVQQELIRCVGEAAMADIARREKGVEFLTAFLEDPNWVESFVTSDPPGNRWYAIQVAYPKALENLYILYRHGKNLDKPVYRRLATAMALICDRPHYSMVQRFQDIQTNHQQGLLHASFDTLNVREMTWAINLDPPEDYRYQMDERQQKIGEYMGACWSVVWLDFNPYGDWLQGPNFYPPWRHSYCQRYSERILGGQCENLSLFGWLSATAHGVMASPVGQPGHCAYIIRIGDRWPVAYDVFGPALTFVTMTGWDGTAYATTNMVFEPVHLDRRRFVAATRMAMIARLMMSEDRANVAIVPGMRYAVYRQGVGDRLPDFSKLVPDAKGPTNVIDLNALKPNPPVNFGVVWRGQIAVSRSSEVNVILRSDDQSRLSIDNEPVLELSCARQEKTIKLSAGRHALRVDYCQGGGAADLEVEFRGVNSFGDWKTAYGEAIKAQPLNYRIWAECAKAMDETRDVPLKVRRKFALSAVRAFSDYHETAWVIMRRAIEKAMPSMKPADRIAFFLQCHELLQQEGAKQFDGYRFDLALDWQADQMGPPEAQLDFFSQVLASHAAEPPNDRLFGMTLDWGQNRFKNNPATASKFAGVVGAYFRKHGGDKNVLNNQIQNGIRSAGERGDIAAGQSWMKLGEELLPKLQPADILLSPEQAKAFPKVQPFAATLLSGDGVLHLSSRAGEDRPLSYRALLRGEGLGGIFHTNGEENPWAQVQLPGNANITGIVLVNRYENVPDRQIPLKVSTSLDGRTWTEAVVFNKAENVFRVDLRGKNVEAKFVRVERPATAGRRDPFHLRAILIYGKKLY